MKEIDILTQTIETSLLNHTFNIEIKACNYIQSNPKNFYAFAKGKKISKDNIGSLISKEGILTNDKREMAELLFDQYQSVYSTPDPNFLLDIDELFPLQRSTGHNAEVLIPLEESYWTSFAIQSTVPPRLLAQNS